MKKVLLSILSFILSLGFLYLVGSFIATDFNPSEWHLLGRVLMAVFGVIISASVAFGVYIKLDLNEDW